MSRKCQCQVYGSKQLLRCSLLRDLCLVPSCHICSISCYVVSYCVFSCFLMSCVCTWSWWCSLWMSPLPWSSPPLSSHLGSLTASQGCSSNWNDCHFVFWCGNEGWLWNSAIVTWRLLGCSSLALTLISLWSTNISFEGIITTWRSTIIP